jgi:hypothetical protein
MTLTPLAVAQGRCPLGVSCGPGHALAFAVLGVALAGAFVTSAFARRSPRRALSMLLLLLWIFAALTELAQAEVGRDASLADWLWDMGGAVTGLLVGGFALRLLLSRRLPASVPAPRASRARPPRPRAARRPR